MEFKILKIDANITYPLRHALLRKGKPLRSCYFKNDKAKETVHLGAFKFEKLIGILSAYYIPCPEFENLKGYQLRAIAVNPKYQRQGIASLLIQNILGKIIEKQNADHIWLNARIAAQKLYESNGFYPIGKQFEINSIGTHQRFIKLLSNEN